MYLSRVEIDTKNRKKMRDLTHVGVYHAWVEDSFPKSNFLIAMELFHESYGVLIILIKRNIYFWLAKKNLRLEKRKI